MREVRVIGAGPAGCAAAIAALDRGSEVTLYERSALPRHRVCGEFLSPEIAGVLDALGALARFEARRPARITRASLRFGAREKKWTLVEPVPAYKKMPGGHSEERVHRAANRQAPAPKPERTFQQDGRGRCGARCYCWA
ncbi:MAG: FAD-dependent oxidoreductase [Bryobacteraceae bacterium]